MRLHPAVRERIRRFKSIERRNQTVLGRGLLAAALVELGAVPDVLASLGIDISGGPAIPSGFYGSIAHTDGVVGAVAALGGPIGLDIEHCWHSFKGIHLERERGIWYWDLGDWVAREAVTKASGVSLAEVLSAPLVDGIIHLCAPWAVQTFMVENGCMAGIATPKRVAQFSPVWLDLDHVLDRTQL